MNIGEQINNLRKKNNLSQDEFANLFHISRQTVSNWETGKSYPDLEMIVKISDYFQISLDDLLKRDSCEVDKNDFQGKKKKRYLLWLVMLLLMITAIGIGVCLKIQSNDSVNFTMKKEETYRGKGVEQPTMKIGYRYFTLSKNDQLDINVKALTDDGKLHVIITDDSKHVYYQLDGQELEDFQTLHFDKGSYIIQITADDYTEDVVSLEYCIEVNN